MLEQEKTGAGFGVGQTKPLPQAWKNIERRTLRNKISKKTSLTGKILFVVLLTILFAGVSCQDITTSELFYSQVDLEYKGENKYTIWLRRYNLKNNFLDQAFTLQPILRVTDECKSQTLSYCSQVYGETDGGADIVEMMGHDGGGTYKYDFDMGDRSGSFTPLIYFEYDEGINQNQFLAGSSIERNDGYATTTVVEVTDTSLDITNQVSSNDNSFIYSFLLYDAAGGSKTIGYEYNNCMEIKINGVVYHAQEAVCNQGLTYSGSIPFYLEGLKRYYVEIKYTQILSNSNFKFGDLSGGTLTSYTSPNTKRPFIFSDSATKTTRFGDLDSSTKSDITFASVVIFLAIAAVFGLGASCLKQKSSVAFFSIVHYVQLMLLTPLIGITIGIDVEKFYNLIDFILLNFNWLTQDVVFTDFKETEISATFFQGNKYLTYIGLESGSAIYNLGQLIFFGAVMIVTCVFVCILSKCLGGNKSSKAGRFGDWLSKFFFMDLQIRLFMMSFTFVYLCAFSEIAMSNDHAENAESYIISWVILVLYFIFAFCMLIHWCSTNSPEQRDKLSRFEEVFRGCKQSQGARFWPIVWTARIIFIVTVLCIFNIDEKFWALSIVLIGQVFYLAFVALTNPFEQWVDYVVELVTGGMFALQIFFLYIQDERSRWNEGVDNFYLFTIICTVLASTVLVIVWAVATTSKKEEPKGKKYMEKVKSSVSMEVQEDEEVMGTSKGIHKNGKTFQNQERKTMQKLAMV